MLNKRKIQLIKFWIKIYFNSLVKTSKININKTDSTAITSMAYIDSIYDQFGLAFSIIGLALVVPTVFLFKQYFRFLDHIQLAYLYAGTYFTTSQCFSLYLDDSWTQFIPNFLKFCKSDDLVCVLGFALSFTICLIGAIALIMLIVVIEKCRKPDLRAEPVYSVFKGLFRWTYLPIAYYALLSLITELKNGTDDNLIASIVLVVYIVLMPTIQLIGYKLIQEPEHNIWFKWFQFLGYMRLALIALLIVFENVYDNKIPRYFIFGVLVAYALLFLWKHQFSYKLAQRILFGTGQALAIAMFAFFIFDKDLLMQHDLDFIFLAVILLLDIIYYILKLVSWMKYGDVNIDKINPQEVNEENERQEKIKVESFNNNDELDKDFQVKKKNKYDETEEDLNLQHSRDSLMESVRKGNSRRKR